MFFPFFFAFKQSEHVQIIFQEIQSLLLFFICSFCWGKARAFKKFVRRRHRIILSKKEKEVFHKLTQIVNFLELLDDKLIKYRWLMVAWLLIALNRCAFVFLWYLSSNSWVLLLLHERKRSINVSRKLRLSSCLGFVNCT